mgnify:CR=1 FL=1
MLTGADVEPVLVIGSELLVDASLNEIDPLRHRELAGALEVSSVLLNEVLGSNVDDSGGNHLIVEENGKRHG